jgi:hypothetical protein
MSDADRQAAEKRLADAFLECARVVGWELEDVRQAADRIILHLAHRLHDYNPQGCSDCADAEEWMLASGAMRAARKLT